MLTTQEGAAAHRYVYWFKRTVCNKGARKVSSQDAIEEVLFNVFVNELSEYKVPF